LVANCAPVGTPRRRAPLAQALILPDLRHHQRGQISREERRLAAVIGGVQLSVQVQHAEILLFGELGREPSLCRFKLSG
jgi:hypothetical protein